MFQMTIMTVCSCEMAEYTKTRYYFACLTERSLIYKSPA